MEKGRLIDYVYSRRFILKKGLIFLISLLIFSCDDFFTRFDPIEAGKNILTMDEIRFDPFYNAPLSMTAMGNMDHDNLIIELIMPPSLDLSATPLIAECRLRADGFDGGEEFWLLMNRYWNNNDKVALDRKDFDPGYSGDSSFINEYTLKVDKKLLCNLNLQSVKYSSNNTFNIRMVFNDLAEPAFDPPTLDETDFLAGLWGSNFTAPVVGDFNPTLPAASKGYDLTLTAIAEGFLDVTFLAGSVLHSTNMTLNSASNTLIMIYDATAPSPAVPFITLDQLDDIVAADEDAQLTMTFNQSTDPMDLTTKKGLLYSFYFDNNAGDVNGTAAVVPGTAFELLYQGQKYVSYQSSYTWTYEDMPPDMKNLLINGSSIFLNVIVQDRAFNSTIYSSNVITYNGP